MLRLTLSLSGSERASRGVREPRPESPGFSHGEVQIKDLSWGHYPVKVITGDSSHGRPIAMAYLGLNDGGNVVAIGFFFSRIKENHEKEKEIWNRFIYNTRIIKPEELLKTLGFEVSPGKTIYASTLSTLY